MIMATGGHTDLARTRARSRTARRTRYATLTGDREEILRRYLPLVRRVVQRLAVRKPPHIELDDLVSWGIVGLLDAIEKYDPKKEALFSTYAQFRIRGAILDHLRSLDWVPRSVRQKAALIDKVSHELEGRLGRPPTEEEIAGGLEITLPQYQELLGKVGEMTLFSLEDLGFGSGEERLAPDGEDDEAHGPIELARGTEEEKQSQLRRLADFHARHADAAPAALEHLKDVAASGGNTFAALMDAVRVCSLGQITTAFFEVGGAYRRTV